MNEQELDIDQDDIDQETGQDDIDAAAIPLSDPDITGVELAAVDDVMRSAAPVARAGGRGVRKGLRRLSRPALRHRGSERRHRPSSHSRRLEIGPGDEVIAPSFSYRETAQAIAASGATAVFSDIDYWSGVVTAAKAEVKITPKTRAIVAANTNGHPADWTALRELATRHGLPLIEDSTEAIGSKYKDALVGHLRRRRRFRLFAAVAAGLRRRGHDRHRRPQTRHGDQAPPRPCAAKNALRFPSPPIPPCRRK